MQTLTKTEVSWMVKEFEQQSAAMAREAKQKGTAAIDRSFLQLRSEQFQSIAAKLTAALNHGDKRIEIKY